MQMKKQIMDAEPMDRNFNKSREFAFILRQNARIEPRTLTPQLAPRCAALHAPSVLFTMAHHGFTKFPQGSFG
jgi:hypothetical protein